MLKLLLSIPGIVNISGQVSEIPPPLPLSKDFRNVCLKKIKYNMTGKVKMIKI